MGRIKLHFGGARVGRRGRRGKGGEDRWESLGKKGEKEWVTDLDENFFHCA